jgi:hypothetical protein
MVHYEIYLQTVVVGSRLGVSMLGQDRSGNPGCS